MNKLFVYRVFVYSLCIAERLMLYPKGVTIDYDIRSLNVMVKLH